MNDRGKELIERFRLECRDNVVGASRPTFQFTQDELERFAALIIDECCEVGEEADLEYYKTELVINKIRDHFGV